MSGFYVAFLVLLSSAPDAIEALQRENRELRATNTALRAQIASQKKRLAEQQKQLDQCKRHLRHVQEEVRRLRATMPPPATQPAALINLADLRARKHSRTPTFKGALSLGKTGRFENPLRVLQVIGKTELLIETHLGTKPHHYHPRTGQPVGPYIPIWRSTLWISSISTAGIVDGMVIETAYRFRVVGTKQYVATTGERKTVFRICPEEPES